MLIYQEQPFIEMIKEIIGASVAKLVSRWKNQCPERKFRRDEFRETTHDREKVQVEFDSLSHVYVLRT